MSSRIDWICPWDIRCGRVAVPALGKAPVISEPIRGKMSAAVDHSGKSTVSRDHHPASILKGD